MEAIQAIDTPASADGERQLVLRFLGPPAVVLGGRELIGSSNLRALALLAYLAVEQDRPHSRDALASLFWPDQDHRRVQQNLRKALSRLRHAIGDTESDAPNIVAGAHDVRFVGRDDCRLDVDEFQSAVHAAEHHAHRRLEACPSCIEELGRACGLYRGPFLDGLLITGASDAFDEWLVVTREQLNLKAVSAMQSIANAHLARGDAATAEAYARRLLKIDPWNEAAERTVMRALAATRGRNTALRHYDGFRQLLLRELEVVPEDATRALATSIRDGELPEQPLRDPTAHIPVPVTPLVGRLKELQRITELLSGSDARLVTLHGPGGAGKTRIALQTAEGQAPLWRDGVWFVPLSDVQRPEAVAGALANALGMHHRDRSLDMAEVAAHLRHHEALLVLDAFEHLVESVPQLSELLELAPMLRVLVTSRVRLGLRGEWVVEISGLPVPERGSESEGVAALKACDSVRLFAACARRSAEGFAIDSGNAGSVARISRAVGGLPLGIELAASWVRLLSCEEIAREIERTMGFLHVRSAGVPSRQASLRSTFESSYRLLSDDVRTAFRRLSVFRGGFTPAAAEEVAGIGASLLAATLDNALVRQYRSGRLDSHAALRAFAAEQLAAEPDEERRARAAHRDYYLSLLQEAQERLHSDEADRCAAQIGPEMDNILAAWDLVVAEGDIERVGRAMGGLRSFFFQSGRYLEAQRMFGLAADRMLALTGDDGDGQRLAGLLREAEADFAMRQGGHAELARLAEEVIGLSRRAGDSDCEARGLFYRGKAQWQRGEHGAARDNLEQALRLARGASLDGAGAPIGMSVATERWCVNLLGGICWGLGDMAGAEDYLLQLRDLAAKTGSLADEAVALGNLGVVAEDRGDYAAAKRHYDRSMAIAVKMGRRVSAAHTNLAELCIQLGDYATAEEHLQLALSIVREQGARNSEALALEALALLRLYLDNLSEAAELSRDALAIAEEMGELDVQASALLLLGHALLAQGDSDGAGDAYDRCLEMRRDLEQPKLAMAPLSGLARLHLMRGDAAAALTCVDEILAHLGRDTLDGVPNPSDVRFACYEVLDTLADPRAHDVLGEAYDDIQQRAARISDAEQRASFLTNVRANRAIADAWRGRTA